MEKELKSTTENGFGFDMDDGFGKDSFLGKNYNVAGPEEVARGSLALTALFYSNSSADNTQRREEEEERQLSFRLHTVVRIIGIVCYDVGTIPRIHVLQFQQLQPLQYHPLADQIMLRPSFDNLLRQDLIRILGSSLQQDNLAAEYCLMALVSNIASRSPYTLLGKLSLNLVLPPGVSSKSLISTIDTLFPRTIPITVSMSTLNAGPIYPKKNADSDTVIASKLQIAPGSVLIIDETSMGEGQLSAVGVKNLQALAEVSKRRVVPLELAYDSTEIETDCAVIVLSNTKALTPCDVAVYVPENDSGEVNGVGGGGGVLEMGEEKLWRMRTVVGMIGEGGVHHGLFNVDGSVSKQIESDFVQERKGGLKNGEEALQRWLCIARALARSHGESDLSVERWKQALAMENARIQRLPRR